MSLPGKILALLNMLGALGLTYMMGLDYAKHVTWEQAVFRSDLLIRGLPLSDEDRDNQGNPLVEDLTPDLLRQVFSNAGLPPVKTQVAEVKRVQELLQKQIDAASGPQAQLAEYARVLLPLATTNLQRETLLSLNHSLADPKGAEALKKQLSEAVAAARKEMAKPDNKLKFTEALATALREKPGEPARPFEEDLVKALSADEAKSVDQVFKDTVDTQHTALKSQFETLFRVALEEKRTVAGQSAPKDRPKSEHRAAIARLLFNFVEVLPQGDAAAAAGAAAPADIFEVETYRRVFAVVGLDSAVREINAQSIILADILTELKQELARDRSTFSLAHTQLVGQAEDLAEKVDRAKADVVRASQQATAQGVLVAKRKKDVDDAEKDLSDARKITATRFKELVDMRNALFNIRVEVREATAANQKRAQKIAELEERATGISEPRR